MIQFHYLKDVHRDWNINDLRDVLARSTAISYCDVGVTAGKAWDTAKNRADLDEEFGTKIFRRLEDLVAHLGIRQKGRPRGDDQGRPANSSDAGRSGSPSPTAGKGRTARGL